MRRGVVLPLCAGFRGNFRPIMATRRRMTTDETDIKQTVNMTKSFVKYVSS